MKKLFLLLVCLSIAPFAQAETGGITGGGGGVTNPDPVGQELVRRAVRDARFLLHAYLNELQFSWELGQKQGRQEPELEFLFGGEKDVFHYLPLVALELKDSGPCLTEDGRAVDGSVSPARPHIVCLSTFTLGTKLSELNFEYETAALLLHEIVHVMGGDEEIARKIQISAVYGLAKTSPGDERVAFIQFRSRLNNARFKLFELRDMASHPRGPWSEQYIDLANELTEIRDSVSVRRGAYPLGVSGRHNFEGQLFKLSILGNYVSSIDPARPDLMREWFREKYLSGFLTGDEVSVDEYMFQSVQLRFPEFAGIFVTKVTSLAAWENELQEMIDALELTLSELERLEGETFTVL